MPDNTENACTACQGDGEVLSGVCSRYADEQPTRPCLDCGGTGLTEVQWETMEMWRDAVKRGKALGWWIVTKS